LIIEVSDDFINPHSDVYGVGGDTKQVKPICACGHNLEYTDTEASGWFAEMKIRKNCPLCGLAFRPQDQVAEIADANGKKSPQPGGLCNRFGIIIDFNKEFPLYVRGADGELVDATPKVSDFFLDTCTAALGVELNEFGYYT
jgi:hypothetical protein